MSAHLLTDWVKARQAFPECLRPEDVEAARSRRLAYLSSPHSLLVIEDGPAFVAWDTQGTEIDTGAPLALLWASEGSPRQLQPLLERSRAKLGDLPQMASAFATQHEWMQVLEDSGFVPWRHYVTRPMAAREIEAPYSLRQAGPADRPFFSALAVQNVAHTLPPQSAGAAATYRTALLQRILRLRYGPETSNEILIAEDEDGEPLGYLWLETGSEHTACVVDIGVNPSYWGRKVAQFLVLSAENDLLARGYQFYVGEISAANRRSYRVATEICGFFSNRVLWRRAV